MIHQKSIQNGLVGGGIVLAYYLIINLINPELLFNNFLVFFPLIVYVGIMSNSGKYYALNAQEFGFRNCFANVWVTGLIILVIVTISQYLLYNLVSPNLHELEYEFAIENAQKQMQILQSKQVKPFVLERLEGLIESLNVEDFRKSPVALIQSIPFGIIFPVSIFALLISAVLNFMNKRKQNG